MLRLVDLEKTVTLEQVQYALEKAANNLYGFHTIDMGEAGYVDVSCDTDVEVEQEDMAELGRVAKDATGN